MNRLNQNQKEGLQSYDSLSVNRHDTFIEMYRLIQELQLTDKLNQEKFREKIQKFKNKILSMNDGKTKNLFGGQNKNYLIEIIKNIR